MTPRQVRRLVNAARDLYRVKAAGGIDGEAVEARLIEIAHRIAGESVVVNRLHRVPESL